MKRYKCIKPFYVDSYDADGFLIENDSTLIEEGKICELDESRYTMIGGEVHLDSIDNDLWLEISKEHLEECFELLEEE